jgi:hypothetical protein
VPGLAMVIPYRTSLFDGGCINDSLRRLTSIDVGSKRNGFEFRKLFIEEKRRDVGETVGSEESTSFIQRKDFSERRRTLTARRHAAAYEGTKAQHLGKGDVTYSHIKERGRRQALVVCMVVTTTLEVSSKSKEA